MNKGATRTEKDSFGTGGVGVMVLGMHRSGTSVVTRMLASLGCDLCGTVIDPQADNPLGYFEHKDVILIHEAFLRQSGRTWSDPGPLPSAEFETRAAASARDRLAIVLERDFHDKPLWVVKDPRLSRLIPLWREPIDALGISPRIVMVVRSPFSVAESLFKRDGFRREKALLLWLRHSLEAERNTRSYERAVIHMEELEASPAAELNRLVNRLGLEDEIDAARIDEIATEVFDPERVHHRTRVDAAAGFLQVHPWVERCHRALCDLGGDDEASARSELDSVASELELADGLLVGHPTGWDNEVHNERYAHLLKELDHHTLLVTTFRKEIEAQRAEVAVLRDDTRGMHEFIEQKHTELLGGSLDLTARVEERWVAVMGERDVAVAERKQLSESLAEALNRAESAESMLSLVTGTRTWRYTSALRTLWGAVRRPFSDPS